MLVLLRLTTVMYNVIIYIIVIQEWRGKLQTPIGCLGRTKIKAKSIKHDIEPNLDQGRRRVDYIIHDHGYKTAGSKLLVKSPSLRYVD